MQAKPLLAFLLLIVVLGVPYALPTAPAGAASDGDGADAVARGRYLVTAMGCADCHTPLVMGPSGPEPDSKRAFSGHPEGLVMPPAPKLEPGPWVATVSGSMTAWSGPWGTSFTANLTPDVETGLGTWTADDFVAAMRSGRHQGRGREILPPMPASAIRNFTDADLRAVFAFLQSLPAIKNRVPNPLPPVAQ